MAKPSSEIYQGYKIISYPDFHGRTRWYVNWRRNTVYTTTKSKKAAFAWVDKRSRIHSVVVEVIFDLACTEKVAQRELRNCIHGNHYCSPLDEGEPDEFRVRYVKVVKP